VDPACLRGSKPPQRGCTLVTEQGLGATGEHRRQPMSMRREHRVSDCVHTDMDCPQATGVETMLNRMVAETEPDQLPVRDDPILPVSQITDRPITWAS
jgi:hypothetical protein